MFPLGGARITPMDEATAPPRQGLAAASLGAALFSAGHLVLVRDLTVAAGGGEPAIAAGLGAALGWVAVGALVGARLPPRPTEAWSVRLLALLPLLFAAELWAARNAGLLLTPSPGAGVLPWQLGLAAGALTAPLALACGLLVPLLASWVGSGARLWPAAGAGFAAGAVGLALAGALGWGGVRSAAALSGAFICMLSALLGPRMGRSGKLALAGWTLAVAAAALVMGATPLGARWTLATANRGGLLGGGAEAVSETEDPSGNLVVLRGEGEALEFFRDGASRARYPDPHARDDALFACGQARSLARVLVIGGARPRLIRELLARGAAQVDIVTPDRGLDEALEPHLSDIDGAALAHPGVRRHYGSVRRFLREHRGYDLAVLTLPQPRSAASARFYSKEFLGELAARLARRGVLVATVPGKPRSSQDHLARLWATIWDLSEGKDKLLSQARFFPGKRCRLAASPLPGGLAFTPRKAARRHAGHRAPGGVEPVSAGEEDFARLIDARRSEGLTIALDRRGEDFIPESVTGPRIHLEYLAQRMKEDAPRSAAALRAVMRMPLWGPFAALGIFFIVGGLLARRIRGRVPGRLALCSAAFACGLAGLTAFWLSATVYGVQSGALSGALPLLLAALCGGLGLGASLAARLGEALSRSPRRALGTVQFGFVLVLLAGGQSVRLPAGSAWTDLAHGLGLAALGFLLGLALVMLTLCSERRFDPLRAAAMTAGAAGLGGLTAGGLAVSGALSVSGPTVVFLVLVAVEVVVLGLLLAGAGRRRAAT